MKFFFKLLFKLAEELDISETNPLIIIVDGHSSRFDADKLLECMKKHIWIFVGVPNATHIYQTCDNQIFKMYQQMRKSLKQQWATTPGYPSMAMQHEVAVSVRSLKSAMSTETVAASCRAVGCSLYFLIYAPDI
eukprot:546845_1